MPLARSLVRGRSNEPTSCLTVDAAAKVTSHVLRVVRLNTLFIYEPEKSAVVFRRTKKVVRQYLKEICMKKLLRRGKQREKLEFENEESLET
mgnify:CR=1 FL=1